MIPLSSEEEAALAVVIDRRKDGPITGKEVAAAIEMKVRTSGKEGADFRAIINSLRVKGYPICASGLGYYWPATAEELDEYVRSFAGRINSQNEALHGLRRGFDKIGQDALELLENVPRPVTHHI